jgi:dihydrodipicolinate synthase/N-acetylneuraminate lyase
VTARPPALAGNWATLLLPIAADDGIDFGALAEEIDLLIAAKVDGIYSNGTAGEFHNQSEAEFDLIQALLAEKCRAAAMPFAIGACQGDPCLSLERIRRCRALGATVLQVILPDWWPVTEAEAADFLAMAAEAAGPVPLLLYNPPHAKRVLAPDEIGRLAAAVPAVVAVKLADGDAAWYAAARRHLGRLAVFVPGHHLATGMREGVAAGAFSNVACLSPRGAQVWTDALRSDPAAGLDLEARLCRFMATQIVPFRSDRGYSNGALDKLLAAVGGWGPVTTRLRRPYRSIAMDVVPALRRAARDLVPEMFVT